MLVDIPTSFVDQVSAKFDEAKANGDVIFNGESAQRSIETDKVGNSSIDIEYTLLPLLGKRPEKGSVDKNPFAKPEPELTILDSFGANNEFRIVLNKFPTVANHFMLITKEFRSQDTPLSLQELVATYTILSKLYEDDEDKEWFAFYNCGPESGASQPHKHVQFMTLPKSRKFNAWADKLSKKSDIFRPNDKQEPLSDAELPFAHYVARLPEKSEIERDPEELTFYFISLLQRVLTTLKENNVHKPSYNFIMTTEYMMLVPRSKGKIGTVGINSCGYLGLILCKNEDDLAFVKETGVASLLGEGGFSIENHDHCPDYLY